MAKKEESKNVLERVYNVPLRREFLKVPRWRRTKKAVKALQEFIAKHMKAERVVISKYANLFLWKNGIRNPPHHIKVNCIKDDKGNVTVELAELPPRAKRELEKQKELAKGKEKKKEEQKKPEAKQTPIDIKAEKVEEKVEEIKKEKEEKEEKTKEIEKEEIKELQKEHPKGHHAHGNIAQLKQKQQLEKRPTAPKSV